MKILTTGSRTWTGIWGTHKIHKILTGLWEASLLLESPMRLMNGACPEGADAIVARWAHRRAVLLEEFQADWLKLGKRAGFVRNQYMVSQGADICVAFLRDNSRGTQNTIDLAKAAGIPTFVIEWPPPVELVPDDLPLVA